MTSLVIVLGTVLFASLLGILLYTCISPCLVSYAEIVTEETSTPLELTDDSIDERLRAVERVCLYAKALEPGLDAQIVGLHERISELDKELTKYIRTKARSKK